MKPPVTSFTGGYGGPFVVSGVVAHAFNTLQCETKGGPVAAPTATGPHTEQPTGFPDERCAPVRAQDTSPVPTDLRAARYAVLAVATFGLMVFEFKLAVQTGSPTWIAWTYPVALDVYAYASFRSASRPDVATALILMALSQGAAHMPALHNEHNWLITIAPWALVMPLVLWRVHHLGTNGHIAADVAEPDPDDTQEIGPILTPPQPEPEPQPEQRRWNRADALSAIAYWESEGLETNVAIAAKMGISAQRVGQYRKANRELVAA